MDRAPVFIIRATLGLGLRSNLGLGSGPRRLDFLLRLPVRRVRHFQYDATVRGVGLGDS